jgi:LIVCS family branched-chain amino acid:cation transporter
MKELRKGELLLVSFMLFSMFFGAGNLIFPPFLGQSAGENLWNAMAGFILSAVGLPILGVVAIAKAGSFQTLAHRVHPLFAVLFPFIIYVSIGPGLAIPRAGSLAYEMGMGPFLPEWLNGNPVSLFLYTFVFFGVVLWMSLSPSKLVDRFGKRLTPLLLTLILVIFAKSMMTPMGTAGPASGKYADHPVFQGFLDGYLTMDALAALVFGIVVANTLRGKGVENSRKLSIYMIGSGIGAGTMLTLIYLILGYLGASSSSLGKAENGAQILTLVMNQLFGSGGAVLLGVVFTLACLCVSIGLVTSCSQFFASVIPRISYKSWVYLVSIISMAIANLGLTQILTVSVPILGAIYPMAIVLILLALADRLVKPTSKAYVTTVGVVALFSLMDLMNVTFLSHQWDSFLGVLPFYAEGAGWLLPALIGMFGGLLVDQLRNRMDSSDQVKAA